jgi:hypothetical protein
MSTGPGPTHKPDGTADASVDDIADLLVEDDSPQDRHDGEQPSDDGLDVMLETPGPALASTFMPPPPSPAGGEGEELESAEEAGPSTNLAYEDLLAKLVLPAKVPEPEPEMPALVSSPPLAELGSSPSGSYQRPSSSSLQVAPPTDERTLVTENPLLAEEQEAAVREGRMASREQAPAVYEELRTVPTAPIAPVNGAGKSRMFYLMLGGLLVLGGMILAVLVLKLLMPTPAPQPPAVIAPAPPAPPPPTAPPAHVEPLPPSTPPAAAAPIPAGPSGGVLPENTAGIPDSVPGVVPPQPKVRKTHSKPARAAVPKAAAAPKAVAAARAASAPKPAAMPKAAVVPAAKVPKAAPAKKPGKSSGYADPFDN